jgi:SP family arabinose:H+ symporter-like MFS transporter
MISTSGWQPIVKAQTNLDLKPYFYLFKSSMVGALGGLLFGFDTAVIAGATHALALEYQLGASALGFTVSSALWGTVLAAMGSGIPGEKFGGRETLRVAAILYVISAFGCAFAWDWYSLIVFRFIGGLGIGCSSVLGPVYIAELAPAKWRGRLVGLFQINVVLGILLAYFSNYLLGTFNLGTAEWRWKLGVSALPAVLFLIMLFTIPRSPRWLARRDKIDEAREVLKRTGVADYEGELRDIMASIKAEHALPNEPLFQRKYKLPIFLAIIIGSFNQLSGINAILYYLNDIFEQAGFGKMSGDLQAVMIGFTNLVAVLIAMTMIDKLGRRTLLLIGSVGCAICLAGVAAIFFTQAGQNYLVWLLVAYIAFFSFSQGAVIWVYLSEIFPTPVRARGQALGSSAHWIMNALISGVFPVLAASSGGYPFAFFALMMVVQFFLVWFIFPETKGVTLEDMEQKLA